MNKFTAFAAAGLMAATALFAVQASAEDNENSAFAQMVAENADSSAPAAHQAYGYGYKEGILTRVSAKASDVTVYRLGELPDAQRDFFRDRAKAEPARVAALQEKIKANHAVSHALMAENVQISSVIGKIKAADGSTAYVIR
ncbi:hypothetical protein [Rhizobium sp. C1]|uniref:hypothetical protein n=1 Tax=Rhizobium sp. C1 TaxID=1349799 RepID=UPI001E459A92|nr:hypothetical protein [Rhizobium sp. C1]MCD2179922.1 hypothetical protein [Rhizobium sp. C1]